ncbi:vacuolar protein sorting protein DigA [Histomonas meleagridis]|uniref:vacuolar protein sorting protein DigA n=1 Tax=Histomonas meleagridis TaxID=135588 RepID=UPI00355993BC|nr:vacuolar protein sorting protein DigA [Histomonas meleagridis]KAH0803911.1 vacuolar protein sorting protein DigA [Histomonas meleagridis]
MDGPSAVDVAFEEEWKPGIDFIFANNIPIDKYDKDFKTPIISVLDKKKINLFNKLVDYFVSKNLMNVLKSIKFTNERSINALYYCVLEHNIEMIEACQYAYVMGLIDDNDVLESEKKWVELYKNEKKPLFLQTLNHLESITAARECFTPDVPLSQFAGIPTRYSLPFDISFHETADFVNYLMFKDIKPPNSLIAFPDDNILYQLPASLLESDDCFVFVNYFDLKQYFRQIINGYFSESLYLTPINTKKDYQVWYYFGVLLGNLSLTGSHFKLPLPLHPLIYASLTCSNVTDTFNDISDDLIEEYLLASNPKQITRIRTKAYNALEKGQFNESLMSNDLQSAWKQVYDEYIDILEKINQGFYDYAKHKEPKLKDFTSFSIQSAVKAIQAGEYDTAAETFLMQNLPFKHVMKIIANCPRMLMAYLYKRAAVLGASNSSQQIVCHLFLQVAIFELCKMDTKEKRKEVERIKQFITEYKQYLNQKIIMKYVFQSSELSLLQAACLAFGDYKTLVSYLFLVQDYGTVQNYILNVGDIMQRQAYMRFNRRDTMKFTESLDSDKPGMSAIFDTFVELSLTIKDIQQQLQGNVLFIFNSYFDMGLFTEPHHILLYFIILAIMNQESLIVKLFEKPEFKILDKDYFVAFLIRRNMYALAAKVFARCHKRHNLAINYGVRDSMATTIGLLQGPLSTAKDSKQCWLQAMRLLGDREKAPPDTKFDKLIEAAYHSKKLTLDDMLPVIPPDMELSNLQLIIADSVQQSSSDIKESDEMRAKIEIRADEQRALVSTPNLSPMTIDPSQALCYICGRPACDSQFEAFPCGHLVHTSCYLLSIGCAQDDKEQISKLKESCPACGTASLVILDKPFVSYENDKEEIEKWLVPE